MKGCDTAMEALATILAILIVAVIMALKWIVTMILLWLIVNYVLPLFGVMLSLGFMNYLALTAALMVVKWLISRK